MKRFQILSHQRGLLFRDAQLIAVLSTGLHRYWYLANRLTLQLVDLNQWHITDPDLVRLYQQHPLLQDHIRRISITPDQVGLLLLNDQLCGLIPPGEQIYLWQQAGNFALQTVPLTTTALPEALRTLLLQNGSEPPELLLSCQQRTRQQHCSMCLSINSDKVCFTSMACCNKCWPPAVMLSGSCSIRSTFV